MVAIGLNIEGNIAAEVLDWETNQRFCARSVPLGNGLYNVTFTSDLKNLFES